MRRTLTLISALALVMSMLALPAASETLPPGTASAPTSAGGVMPYIIAGASQGGNRTCAEVGEAFFDDRDYYEFSSDRVNYGSGFDAPFPSGLIVNTDGTSVSFSSTFAIGAVIVKGSNEANVYVYDPARTSDAGLASPLNESGNPAGLSNLTFCWNDEPLTTDALLSGVKSQDELLPNGTALSGWAISILQWVDGAYVLVPPVGAGTNPVLTGADGAWSFQTPTVVVDDPDDISTYYVCEEQRAGWTQLYPVFDAEADPQTMIQIPGRGTCYIVEVGVTTETVPNLNFVNEVTPGRVDIVKIDEAGNPLANITFSLTRTVDDAKVYDQTCVTNALGQCSFLNVPVATGYVLDEVNGYELGDVFLGDPTDPANLITLPHTFDVAMGTAPATGSLYTFTVENLVGQWCSPGYWRQAHHFGNWPAPYSPTTLVPADIIALYQINQRQLTRSGLEDGPYTLIDVLNHPEVFGGAAFNAIGDLLSGAHTEVNFLGNRVEGSCPLGRAPSA